MVERRVDARRGLAAFVAGSIALALLAMIPTQTAVAAPPVPPRTFTLQASGTCRLSSTATSFPATVRTTGTAPARAEIQSSVTVMVTSATATLATDFDTEPVSFSYGVANEVLARGGTPGYRFSDPAPQPLTIDAGVYGPLTLGKTLSLVVSVSVLPSAPPETVSCELTSDTPVAIALDLPADGSLQWFRVSSFCSFGLQGQVRADLGGVAPTRVAPGERPRLVADSSDRAAMMVNGALVLGVGGSPAAAEYPISLAPIGHSQPGRELLLPPAGTGGTMTVSVREIRGTGFRTGPDGLPITFAFSCGGGGGPALIVIAVSDPAATTTTSTTRPPVKPICALASTVPRWLWNLLVQVFRLDCP